MTDSVDSSNPPKQHNGVNTDGRRASTVCQWEGKNCTFFFGTRPLTAVVLVVPQWDAVGTGREQAFQRYLIQRERRGDDRDMIDRNTKFQTFVFNELIFFPPPTFSWGNFLLHGTEHSLN